MELIEQKLTELGAELKQFAEQAKEQQKTSGAVHAETKTALDAIRERMTAMQTQLDAVDAKTKERPGSGTEEQKSLGQMVIEHAAYAERKASGFMGKQALNIALPGISVPQLKSTITGTAMGSGTSGPIPFQRIPGVVGLAQQALRIRDLMTIRTQDTGMSFDYVYQNVRTNAASPQVEGSAKAESTYGWTSASGVIRDIAHYVNVSKQALADVPWMRATLDGELTYGLKVKEESEILSGDGTGVHLNGLLTQATAFDTSLLVAAAGYTRIDELRYAKLQARLAGLATYAPSAFVMNPYDLAKMELTKDSYGRYIVGDPKTGMAVTMVWGLPCVESDSIAQGTFLVGAFDTAAELIDRQQVSIDISFEHSTNFTSNMATILCEERIGLAVKVAGAFIKGTFSSSPATT